MYIRVGILCLVWCWAATAHASQPSPLDGYRSPTLRGNRLDGWTLENEARVSIRDGVLSLESGTGWLRSDHRYANFRLQCQWKSAGADSGIYFGASPDGRPFPEDAYEVDLAMGREGAIPGIPGAEPNGLSQPAGEWSELDLVVLDGTVTLAMDGRRVYSVDGLEPTVGHLGLQISATAPEQFAFRNLTITELGYRSLFNGKDLSGWEGAGRPASSCWDVRDGAIICTSRQGPWLRSKQLFDDFNLRLEYLVAPGANSGIYVRVPANGNHHRDDETLPSAGFEVQVLDDSAPKYSELKDYQYSGSVYDIAGARQHVGKPPGEWNTLEINCDGHHVTTVHNGVEIVDASAAEFPLLTLRRLNGYLGLQNHGPNVQFRRLRIGPPLADAP